MAFEIQPEDMSELYGMAGQLVGEAEATKKDIARTERIQAQLLSLKNQKEMAAFANQLLLDRMKFQATMGFEKEKRAEIWELEKMEIISRVDFEKEEGERQEKENNYKAIIKKIDETDYLNEETKEKLKLQAYMKLYKTDVPERVIYPEAYGTQKMGTPFVTATLEKEVVSVLDTMGKASSWRPGAYNLTRQEAIQLLEKRLPEFGWPMRNQAQKIQLFSTLDRTLKEHPEIEWTDTESERLAGLLGLIETRDIARLQSPTGEIMEVSIDEWKQKQKEAESEGWKRIE